MKVIISSVSEAGFWRCGVFYPKAGIPVDLGEMPDDVVDRLKAEPMLRIKPASKDDLESLADRGAAIEEAIRSLTADDFQRDGKPKTAALNELLGEDIGKITANERDQVWSQMQDGGFAAPDLVSGD